MAEAETKDLRVRSFAQEMIRDHSSLSDNMRLMAKTAGFPAPDRGMSSDQAMLLGSLQGLRGAEFDKTYVRQQILAHEQALAVIESFSARGSEVNLRKRRSRLYRRSRIIVGKLSNYVQILTNLNQDQKSRVSLRETLA